jgi:hypothetical protein
MKRIVNGIALFSLLLLTAPSFLFLAGWVNLSAVKVLMIIATVLWFVCTLPRMSEK